MRSPAKRNEIGSAKSLFRNGKFFVAPTDDGSDFKQLFKRLAAAGAGRPAGKDGFPAGPWTPELLAEAISEIDTNRAGIDLRTVQLWFQENEKGVSTANIRWLARILGCDDSVAISEWQVVLSAAQSRLSARRRRLKQAGSASADALADMPGNANSRIVSERSAAVAGLDEAAGRERRFHLAKKSEALFSYGSPLNLPASIFAGFAALGFLSYLLGVHSVTYARADGVVKQVGFLWTANWTSVFMVFLPLFFAFATELVIFWKDDGRLKLMALGDRLESDLPWERVVESTSYSYWAVFLICVLFAGLFQWMGVSLIPLLRGGGDYATDWGSLAIVRPEVISVPAAVIFTGLAYCYMSLSFYLFFVGLILMYTVIHDLWRIGVSTTKLPTVGFHDQFSKVSLRVMRGVFRCTVLGILIAIVMKLQSAYLTSGGENILSWLVADMSSAFNGFDRENVGVSYRRPTYYSSLLIAISTCFVFLYGAFRLGTKRRSVMPWARMSSIVVLLAACYLSTDAFAGFSILLGIGMVLAIFSLFYPGLGRENRLDTAKSV